MLKIVVDATAVRSRPSGIGICILNLIDALDNLQQLEDFKLSVTYHPSLKNWVLGNSSIPQPLQQYSCAIVPIPVTLSTWLAQYPNPILPYFEKYFDAPDIVNGTDYFVYPCRQSLKVMNIYDLTFLKYPEYASPIVRKTYADRVRQCLRWTDLIITCSQSTQQDIIQYLGVQRDRVIVVPLASRYSPNFLDAEKLASLQLSSPYDFSQPYILFVSTIEPRKNINTLIEAFNWLKKDRKIEHHLVLIGKAGWNYKPVFTAIENSDWKHHIHHLNYLSDEQVALFYAKADVFVYPSYYEGFGLPILEAMTLGAPVITANTSSLPEVAGDAALLIDPNNSMQLADAIFQVLNDSPLRQKLTIEGKARSQLFSWERTAKETVRAYKILR
jgi:glycosyltransferase involved in cell wall biosynthesis